MQISATDLLQSYTLASLQQMARQRGREVQKSKGALVPALAPVLYDERAVQASLAGTTPVERRLVDLLILAGGNAPTELMRRQLDHEGLIAPRPERTRSSYGSFYSTYSQREKGSARKRGSNKFEDLVARLGALCLVFSAEPVHSTGSKLELNDPGRRLFIPDDILRQLPPVELPIATAESPAVTRPGDSAPLLRDLYLLLSFAGRDPIPLTAHGAIAKRSLVRIDQSLRAPEGAAAVRSEDELRRLPFLRALAEECKVLGASVGELLLDPRAEEFLGLPASLRRRQLFDAYARTQYWCEMFRIPNLSVKGKGASVRVASSGVVAARQRILAELRAMPAGEWISIDHVLERMRLRAYEFLLPRTWSSTSYAYYWYSYGYDQLPNPYGENALGLTFDVDEERAGWDLVEAGFVRVVLTEALHLLGVVDLGESDGSAVAVRITPDGARLLQGEPLPAVDAPPHVVIQPNFQIFALEPTGEDILFKLDQFAHRVRADQAIEYELTRDSVYRAQRVGLNAAAILSFLESVSTVGIPQNVRRSIEEWGSQGERITVRTHAPLLHSHDESTLDALYDDPVLAELLGRRVGPAASLVPRKNLRPLLDHLLARELLPALSERPDARSGVPLAVDTSGRLSFGQRLPSIYDLHRIRPFVDEEGGVMRLTPASLRRGAKDGHAGDDIVATLEDLHGQRLPPEVSALVQRWAKDWGHGALFTATVLQVEHPEALDGLLADPQLRSHLTAIPGAPTLAMVHAEAADRIAALLGERGMTLADRPLR